MKKLNRQDVPPKPGPQIEVIRCEPGPGVHCQIISKHVWGVWTHWDGRRSRECTGETRECEGHAKQWPMRWKGYLYIWSPLHKGYKFLELTPAAAQQIIDVYGPLESLRGLLLRMQRHGKSLRCKITVELTRPVQGDANLPPEVDPEETLRKLWGWQVSPMQTVGDLVG